MKEQIIESALKHFLQHGIRKITIQKLVLPLGISTKTMYRYFNDKQELLEECLKVHYRESDKGVLRLMDRSPNVVVSICQIYLKAVDRDFGINHLFYDDLNYYYPDVQDKVMREQHRAFEIITAMIEQGKNEGYFLTYLKPPVVLETLMELYTSVTRYGVYKEFAMRRELIKQTIIIYLRGICTDKGIQVMDQIKELAN